MFFSTVASSPTTRGCGSPQKRRQALYPAGAGSHGYGAGEVPENSRPQHTVGYEGEDTERLLPGYKTPPNPPGTLNREAKTPLSLALPP